ncbi:glycosyltransferase [Niabella drilacis]|uniref:Glycosyltransferase, catalytic subunit of cellulose synthase and poly-beta-1,6-N-acetylglucosamine synthase n=1 Tax=Niabella drilacis (strain DSM 25811 / CCM 8410 / CCUG 62505 / LMG 26954 / E90) TaxID=1285928 RepID=A0A1G6YT16_NIADE|nr:glycosyltransferase [Niabella drilacis]SDD93644.1 Glycosyltransferase, catalytic subunit of cellulose synthase and poly-beta-1,6-N-acetylglucosamine synthase [Niabella drilacis]
MWLIGITGVLFLLYAVLILFYTRSWNQIPMQVTAGMPVNEAFTFSIIIPARNEAINILPLLDSIKQQQYPSHLFEVIVVDDHSDDNTASLVERFAAENEAGPSIRLIRLAGKGLNSYKKKAIETGIASAQHSWIVCTDADCLAPGGWLQSIAHIVKETDPVFIAAPVAFIEEPTLVNLFQDLDFLTLQGITGASVYRNIHTMCNGANLAYRRDVFAEVDGFSGIDTIASGDDMLLMHKIWKRYPQRIAYLKSKQAIIKTAAAPTWGAFINQRIRWASKATSYDDKRIFAVLFLVYLFNSSFLILFIAGFVNSCYFLALFVFWTLKTIIELPFIKNVATFFGKQSRLKYFFLFQPLHIGYTILAGFLGSFGRYEWKGRRVK